MKQKPMIKRIKDKFKENPNISVINMNISLTNGEKTPTIKDIMEDSVDEKYYISDDKVKKVLNLANLSHEKRKDIVKNKKEVPEVNNKILEGKYICLSHLGQNGGLTCEISRTITCQDVPCVTVENNE